MPVDKPAARLANPTHGKVLKVQLPDLKQDLVNPTNGSWWFIKVRPTKQHLEQDRRIPPTAVGGSLKSYLPSSIIEEDRRIPPTAVGGSLKSYLRDCPRTRSGESHQ